MAGSIPVIAAGLDDSGELHVLGRIDDTIITGGENVHPGEVEAVLERHPAIALACVFGVADPTWGQIIACAIVPRGAPPELDDLASFLARELPSYKRPRQIQIASELPVGTTGKPDRRAAAAPGDRGLARSALLVAARESQHMAPKGRYWLAGAGAERSKTNASRML